MIIGSDQRKLQSDYFVSKEVQKVGSYEIDFLRSNILDFTFLSGMSITHTGASLFEYVFLCEVETFTCNLLAFNEHP